MSSVLKILFGLLHCIGQEYSVMFTESPTVSCFYSKVKFQTNLLVYVM